MIVRVQTLESSSTFVAFGAEPRKFRLIVPTSSSLALLTFAFTLWAGVLSDDACVELNMLDPPLPHACRLSQRCRAQRVTFAII